MSSQQCEVQMCTTEAAFDGLCAFHRKKEIAGQLDTDERGLLWDTCSKGHRWTPENTHYESNSKGGKRRRCKLCLALKAERKKDEAQGAVPPAPVRPKNERMARVIQSFDKAQVKIKGNCHGKYEQWTDYTLETMPSAGAAKAMCEGCPLLQACANNADQTQPGWGIWAGERWYYGRKWEPSMRADAHPED